MNASGRGRETGPSSTPPPPSAFVTTHWSVVLAAGRGDTPRARDALAKLCESYWYPLYAYVRQRGYSPHDAQDLTQEFFARLLEKNTLGAITREKGKFRSYLLTALNHFLVDEWKKARRQKRGGGQVLSLEACDAETRFRREPVDLLTPEKLFEQNWALALLDTVYGQLQREYEADGKEELFRELKSCLTGARASVPYGEAALPRLPRRSKWMCAWMKSSCARWKKNRRCATSKPATCAPLWKALRQTPRVRFLCQRTKSP